MRYHWPAVLILMTLPMFARAASFDCARASDPVEKAICADPTVFALDAQLATAYFAARARVPTQADALRRDQRNWLADRDKEFTSDGTRFLEGMYKERITFLHNVGKANVIELQALLPAWATKDQKVRMSQTQRYESVTELLAHLPAPPDAELLSALQTLVQDAPQANLVWLPRAGVGGVYTMQGTADDETWIMFVLRGSRLRLIETPYVLQQDYNSTSGTLTFINDQSFASNTTFIGKKLTLQFQSWEGSNWSAPKQIEAHFDHAYKVEGLSCAPEINCADARRKAVIYAKRYNREPLPEALLYLQMTTSERAKYGHMLALVHGGAVDQIKICECGGYNDFDDHSSFFPVRLSNEIVLGRIGYGHIGWRVNSHSLLVGFWRLQDNHLIPLAGAEIGGIGKFLVAAPMPAETQ